MIFDRNENRPVSVLLGAGSMGTAILRRVAAGTTILFGDISEKRLDEVKKEYEGYGYAVETQIVDANSRESIEAFAEKAASLGEGIILLKAIELRKQGLDIDECYNRLTELSKCMYQVFTVDSLKHLQRTGRLSNAAMIIGNLLNIKPILMGNEQGQIINIAKVRGTKNAIKNMAERYDQFVVDPGSQIVGIAHSDNQEDTDYLIDLLKRNNPPKEILSVCYEPVTGSHVGPGTVALFFLGDENVRTNR